jgi:glutathione synthase
MPETYASADAEYLRSRLTGGGDWVVKPPAGSFGRDVRRIRDDEDGHRAIAAATREGRYAMLQRFVPEVADGEIRTLIAGGRRIGSYRRRPGPAGLTNLAAGATVEPGGPDQAASELVDEVAADLAGRGVGFAAIDTVSGYLMEVNLANPGGLATLAGLYGGEPGRAVAEAVIAWRCG